MDDLHLSEPLQRYFSDCFLCCDETKTGKASLSKTIELIRTGNVPDDIIVQISDICWNNNTQQLTKRQFFSALKLVAAYQARIVPLDLEILYRSLELPLPRFLWTNDHEVPTSKRVDNDGKMNEYKEHIDTTSTDSEADSDTLSIVKNGSPEPSSTASDSPTPTNSVQDRCWAATNTWHGLVSEEQRQLLGTEEESSDRHSSDDDEDEDEDDTTEISSEIWTINHEQRDYYANQFRSLQPDTSALLAGPIARTFFEKSRLPVHELRRIWQLADVTRDGALSLEEFNTAMHLVVLRRNHIELPDVLPPTLIPGNTAAEHSRESTPKDIQTTATAVTNREWTKFVDSPTGSLENTGGNETATSSPGLKPVNFDFPKSALDKDPLIVHPVPLRLTPECNNHPQDETDDQSPKRGDTIASHTAIQRPQPKKITQPGPGAIPPPPPPTVINAAGGGGDDGIGPVSLPAFPPPKKEKPPPPPPRPFKTHGRSSSLDLNRLSGGNRAPTTQQQQLPPMVPPRISPNSGGSGGVTVVDGNTGAFPCDFDALEKYENVHDGIFPGDMYEAERRKLFARYNTTTGADAPRKHGAFEVYRKPAGETCGEDRAKWELFQRLQEENSVLLRICQELSQELAEVKEEKLALKVRLEQQQQPSQQQPQQPRQLSLG